MVKPQKLVAAILVAELVVQTNQQHSVDQPHIHPDLPDPSAGPVHLIVSSVGGPTVARPIIAAVSAGLIAAGSDASPAGNITISETPDARFLPDEEFTARLASSRLAVDGPSLRPFVSVNSESGLEATLVSTTEEGFAIRIARGSATGSGTITVSNLNYLVPHGTPSGPIDVLVDFEGVNRQVSNATVEGT